MVESEEKIPTALIGLIYWFPRWPPFGDVWVSSLLYQQGSLYLVGAKDIMPYVKDSGFEASGMALSLLSYEYNQ